jgi:hypothetical protein
MRVREPHARPVDPWSCGAVLPRVGAARDFVRADGQREGRERPRIHARHVIFPSPLRESWPGELDAPAVISRASEACAPGASSRLPVVREAALHFSTRTRRPSRPGPSHCPPRIRAERRPAIRLRQSCSRYSRRRRNCASGMSRRMAQYPPHFSGSCRAAPASAFRCPAPS